MGSETQMRRLSGFNTLSELYVDMSLFTIAPFAEPVESQSSQPYFSLRYYANSAHCDQFMMGIAYKITKPNKLTKSWLTQLSESQQPSHLVTYLLEAMQK